LRFGLRSGLRTSKIRVKTDLSALLTALYVKIDDEIGEPDASAGRRRG
jgi:hypothetical protein